jgi:hypothetical protein
MPKYTVYEETQGHEFGVYSATTPGAALRKVYREAGVEKHDQEPIVPFYKAGKLCARTGTMFAVPVSKK